MKIILAKMIRTMAVICTIIVQIDLASKWHTIICYKICTRPGQTTARATMQVDTAQAMSHITKNQHSITQTKTPPPVSTPPPLPLPPLPPSRPTTAAGDPPRRHRQRRTTMRRHLTEWLCDPGSYRALCSAPLPPPFWAAGMMTMRTGRPASCRPPAMGTSWHLRCAGRRRHCRRRRERGGGQGGSRNSWQG